ncbi:hypothetical protein MPER_09610, partial [Moniliophthora perniciosa FA553]
MVRTRSRTAGQATAPLPQVQPTSTPPSTSSPLTSQSPDSPDALPAVNGKQSEVEPEAGEQKPSMGTTVTPDTQKQQSKPHCELSAVKEEEEESNPKSRSPPAPGPSKSSTDLLSSDASQSNFQRGLQTFIQKAETQQNLLQEFKNKLREENTVYQLEPNNDYLTVWYYLSKTTEFPSCRVSTLAPHRLLRGPPYIAPALLPAPAAHPALLCESNPQSVLSWTSWFPVCLQRSKLRIVSTQDTLCAIYPKERGPDGISVVEPVRARILVAANAVSPNGLRSPIVNFTSLQANRTTPESSPLRPCVPTSPQSLRPQPYPCPSPLNGSNDLSSAQTEYVTPPAASRFVAGRPQVYTPVDTPNKSHSKGTVIKKETFEVFDISALEHSLEHKQEHSSERKQEQSSERKQEAVPKPSVVDILDFDSDGEVAKKPVSIPRASTPIDLTPDSDD